ncbi:MAG: radical SAM/SPASM domain protein, ACGX system [Lachnospiraceae bacterium]|nr:radical SAM/SPASM domain protein, ACGX system [Lachnospiraceae bacterium]
MSQYFAFQWHITEECDQRCKHCYIFAEDTCKSLDSMTWEEMQDVVKNAEEFCEKYERLPYFYITGGDPILHPDFWKLMEMLKEKEIPFTILGNPFHLTKDNLKRLKECGCDKYQLSIDGDRTTHDWFRKPGSFDETIEKIGMIRDAGITSVVMTTVSSVNIKQVPKIIDTVVEAKADVFAFARYVPTSEEKSTGISSMEYRELLDICDKKYKEYENDPNCVTYFNRKDHLWTLFQYEIGEFKIPETAKEGMIYGGCNCGNCHITILPTGDVYACRRVADSKVGNVFENRLKDLWINQMEEYREFTKFTQCSKCKLLAWCRGCPAVAKGTYGEFYDVDPQCWLMTSPKKSELLRETEKRYA